MTVAERIIGSVVSFPDPGRSCSSAEARITAYWGITVATCAVPSGSKVSTGPKSVYHAGMEPQIVTNSSPRMDIVAAVLVLLLRRQCRV